jgi:hypothetical protein
MSPILVYYTGVLIEPKQTVVEACAKLKRKSIHL